MRNSDEIPSTERLEILKDDLLKLAHQAKEKVESQDPEHKKVLVIDPLTTNHNDNNDEWFVVGDIHSDFQTLSRILLKIYLRPKINPEKIKIIFLGDYIDRGTRPMEVLKLLLSLKTKWPEHFWLLRGNHEFLKIGDDGIVVSKVCPSDTTDLWKEYFGEEVFRALAQLFEVMPVAILQPMTLYDKHKFEETEKIMYTHGGIPRTEHLQLPIGAPECWDEFCCAEPELNKEDVFNGPGQRFSFARKDFFEFTKKHNICLIVRGHTAHKDGLDLHEEVAGTGHRIITIHSCGGTDNPDSQYGAGILVPRFLNMRPLNTLPLPIAVEEAYRDDFLVHGNFIIQNNDLCNQIISGLESKLKESSLVTFNLEMKNSSLTENRKDEDPSNNYDSGNFGIFLQLDTNTKQDRLDYEIWISDYRQKYSIEMNKKWNLNEAINIISEKITKVYPVFGKLPQQILKN